MRQEHKILTLFILFVLLFGIIALFSCVVKPPGQYKRFTNHCGVNMTGAN